MKRHIAGVKGRRIYFVFICLHGSHCNVCYICIYIYIGIMKLCRISLVFNPWESKPLSLRRLSTTAWNFFAGKGNLSKCMRLSGLSTLSLDVKYPAVPDGSNQKHEVNCMDMTTTSGFWPFGCELRRVLSFVSYHS